MTFPVGLRGVSGTTLRAWTDGTLRLTVTDGDLASGGAALAAQKAYFGSLKVVYAEGAQGGSLKDTNGAADTGEGVVVDEDFGGDTITPTYDDP